MTGDLAAWLRAQLDADEQTARLALDVTEQYAPDEAVITEWAWVRFTAPLTHPGNRSSMFFDGAHDPAFTLADITAKRTIIDLHECAPGPIALAGNIDPAGWRESDIPRCDADWSPYPCDTLRLLAQPYAGRPGWHNEWNIT